jgi:Fe-S-cluster containining protein
MSTEENGSRQASARRLRVLYDCSKCPAYCCSYDRINVTGRDIARLAANFGISYQQAERRFTKIAYGERVLRHKKDHIFKRVCQFLDSRTRRCTVYEARPAVCRQYPEGRRCGYYDFLIWERERQGDNEFIPSA